MIAPAGFATTIMIARFANELCRGMVEMTVINELAFPTSRRYPGNIYLGKDILSTARCHGVRMTNRQRDSPLQTSVTR